MERWLSVREDNVHLATIRVYHTAKSASGKSPRILLTLPSDPNHPATGEFAGDVYEMDMVQESVENQVVIAEREKEPPPVPGTRARTTVLTGRVKHECNLRPMFSDRYRQRLKMRTIAANTPRRQIMHIEDAGVGGRGNINMLTSGVANTTPLSLGVCRSPFLCIPLTANVYCFWCISGDQSQERASSSSAWRGCRATSCSTSFSGTSRSANGGRSRYSETVRSSRRRTSRRSSARLPTSTAAASTTAPGSSSPTSEAKGWVALHSIAAYVRCLAGADGEASF